MAAATDTPSHAARRALEENVLWYHTLELAPGVVTPGQIDNRPIAPRILPERLDGMRALDVGTFDGFWAFELERRGAEVVATDIDTLASAQWSPLSRARLEERVKDWGMELGRGFTLASAAIGSRVERVVCDVMNLEPGRIGGPVDLAFCGDLLLHLRDPVGALERIRSVLAPGGRLISYEQFSLAQTVRAPRRPAARFQAAETEFNWWVPNLAALRAWYTAAGLTDVERLAIHRPPVARGQPFMRQWHASHRAGRP